jgi:hypothetical protein
MRRVAILGAALAAFAGAGAASSGAPNGERSFTATAPVTGMSADGSMNAFTVAAKPRDCYHVDLWNRSARSVVRLGRAAHCGPVTSTGSGLVGPGLAGNRALWITYTGGNIREWSLWTATGSATTPRRLQFVARDVERAGPFVLGEGDSSAGFVLPLGIDRQLVSVRRDGTRVVWGTAAARLVAVTAQRGQIAAALETGPVEIFSAPGKIARTEAFSKPVDAIRLAGGGALVAQQGRLLSLRAPGVSPTWMLAAGSKLADADGTLAVLVRRNEIHLFSLATGKDVRFRTTRVAPVAQLEPAGLVYAAGRTVTFVPHAQLAARLGE